MATVDEKERFLEEERPGPSDLESVLLDDTLKDIQLTDGPSRAHEDVPE